MHTALSSLIKADIGRMRLLGMVQSLGLPDCWIGAGFVRSAVWDHLHDLPASILQEDVDVVWFDKAEVTSATDRELEARLKAMAPSVQWSVKNQARMHLRNSDEPYISTKDALRHWPETATAIAVRLFGDRIEVLAPYGLDDLFSMLLRPTPAFTGKKLPIFQERLRQKRWLERWPRLVLVNGNGPLPSESGPRTG